MGHMIWVQLGILLGALQTTVEPIQLFHPPALTVCLKRLSVGPQLRVVERRNPFYLRGDFNADGRPDYAVVVQVVAISKEALLICDGGDKPVLLGVVSIQSSHSHRSRQTDSLRQTGMY